jgi:hypothetical protein
MQSYRQQQEQDEQQQFTAQTESATAGTSAYLPNSTRNSNMNQSTDLNSLSFAQLVPTNSNYLKKEDVGEDGVILTIRGFKQETIKGDNGDETKVVMYFAEEGYKPMVLNNTNATILGKITGCQTAGEARGKQIVVYDDPTVSFGGKNTGGLRLKKVQGQPQAPRQAAQAAQSTDSIDPFDAPF